MRPPHLSSLAQFALVLLAVTIFVLFGITVASHVYTAHLDAVSPNWSETPLSGLMPLSFALLIVPPITGAGLAILACLRFRFAGHFAAVIFFLYVLAISPEFVAKPIALKWSNAWHPLWFGPSADYPVLVFVPNQTGGSYSASVIRWAEVKNFVQQNPEHTFLTPNGQFELAREQLNPTDSSVRRGHQVPQIFISSLNLPNGRQLISIAIPQDRIESEYEAETKQIYPKYVRRRPNIIASERFVQILLIALEIVAFAAFLRFWRRRSADFDRSLRSVIPLSWQSSTSAESTRKHSL